MRSSNPVLKEEIFQPFASSQENSQVMTLQSTINKSAILILLTFCVAAYFYTSMSVTPAYVIGSGILGFVLAIIISFKPTTAPALAPLYAIVKGVFVGSISLTYGAMYEGIVSQALIYTFATLFGMLTLYKFRVIQASEKMRSVLFAGIFALIGVRVIAWIMGLFGSESLNGMIHGSGIMSIGISVLAVGLAAFFLILDFDMIEKGSQSGAPKHMEWYAGFALLVTLIWLYLEILQLLAKLRGRD